MLGPLAARTRPSSGVSYAHRSPLHTLQRLHEAIEQRGFLALEDGVSRMELHVPGEQVEHSRHSAQRDGMRDLSHTGAEAQRSGGGIFTSGQRKVEAHLAAVPNLEEGTALAPAFDSLSTRANARAA